jgi:hypothetical protein
MSEALEGIWFPIANNHHLQNPINDQLAETIKATINPPTVPGNPRPNRKSPIGLPIADDYQPHDPTNDRPAEGNRSIINLDKTSSTNQLAPIKSYYRSPIHSRAKADLVDGLTQLVTDRVHLGWSCHLITILFSQLPGTRSTIVSRMKDEVHRIYSTLVTRVHRKPRTAPTDELPVLIGAMDLPVHKHDKVSGPMVLCNGGLHVHALMLVPPTSRLKESLADHFREKREQYVRSGRSALRIDVRPVTHDHRRVVDYVFKTVLNGRPSYDDAVLVLPRSRSEL